MSEAAGVESVQLGDVITLSSGDFIRNEDYRSGKAGVVVVGAGGPIGDTKRPPNTPSPAVIIGRVGAAGAVHYYDEAVYATDNTLIAIPDKSTRPRFLFHFLKSVDWSSLRTGSTQPLVNQGSIKHLAMPRLSVEVQDQLVTLIDATSAASSAARAHLDAAYRALTRFRQSVLATACSGQLTADWRGIGNAEPTVGTPPSWREHALSECVDVLDSKRIPINSKERALRVGPIPYYGATGQVGWIDDYLFDEELVLLGEDGAPFLDKSKPIAYVIEGKSWVNNHAHVLRVGPLL